MTDEQTLDRETAGVGVAALTEPRVGMDIKPRPVNATKRANEVRGDDAHALGKDMVEREPAIEVSGVSKCYQIYNKPSDRLKQALVRWKRTYYREFWAVRDVSFTLYKGESVGIIGRNGSGKSTLFQMIAGTLNPTCGNIKIHGQVSALLELGAGFNPEFTGRENVYLAGLIRGFTRKQVDALMDDILAFADIGDFVDQPVKTYSSGMYVRLAFAVAAQVRPEILIVDEALAVGDVFFQQKCHRFMREELKDTTRLIATHDLNAVATHCNRAIVMHEGRVAFEGKPLDAISFYTQIVHTEQFGGKKNAFKGANQGKSTHASGGGQRGDVAGPSVGSEAAGQLDVPWRDVPEDKTGGAGEVTIRRIALCDSNGQTVQALSPDDPYVCYFEIESTQAKENLIFGVIMYDRFGKPIFGDNSLSLPEGRISLPKAGRYVVKVEYRWPRVQPGEYTATYGVGEGIHALHHTVQCWAHGVISVTGISPREPIHGTFTNPMKDIKVYEVG